MGVLGKYCAECVYEREDQERLHFQGNINGRELLVYYPNPKFQELVKKPRKLPSPNDPVVPSQMPEVKPFLTPDKYASTDTSGFAVSVSGNTTFNADLTGPPIK